LCGTESGRYVALDLGGTNFRVLMIELKGQRDSAPDVVSKVFLIPLRIMLGTAQMASHSLYTLCIVSSYLFIHLITSALSLRLPTV